VRKLFLLALIVRVVAIFATGPSTIRFGDGLDYIDTAKALCATHSYPDRGSLPFFRAPGLPFFIGGVTAGHPAATLAIKLGLALCDAVTVLLIASLADAAGWLAGLTAGLIAAFNPFFIVSVCDVRSEPLFMMLLTLAIWCLLRGREGGAGVALALAALTRPAALLCIPLFALWRPRRAHLLLGAALLTLAPWTIRNAVRFHELIVVNDAGGFNLWRGYAREIVAIDGMEGDKGTASWEFDAVRVKEAQRAIEGEAATPQARSRAWRRAALDEIRRDPAAAFRWTLRKAWLYWRPWLAPGRYPWPVVLASGLFNLLLYAGAAFALARPSDWRFACRDRRFVRGVLLFFAVMWLAQLPFQVVMRFRQPFTDPLLIVLAAQLIPWRRRGYADGDRAGRSAAPAHP
jgi:4-amino-4-deoxy-L-arabinose transferase-like glycosyltransferase